MATVNRTTRRGRQAAAVLTSSLVSRCPFRLTGIAILNGLQLNRQNLTLKELKHYATFRSLSVNVVDG